MDSIHKAVLTVYNTQMGGFGSGRRDGGPTADASKRIDLAWMMRQRFAEAGECRSGRLNWTCGGEPAGNISFTCDMRDPGRGSLELRYTVTDRWSEESQSYVQRIALSYTRPHFGGKRWWMHCPATGERVGKLYCPTGAHTFASRKAWNIGYRSQRLAERDKPFEALFRLQKRLGCPQGWDEPIQRPKGMWRRTYERLEEEYWELDAQCAAAMMGVIGLSQVRE